MAAAEILEKGGQRFGLNLRWPKRLKGSWLQSSGFLLIGLFSAVTLTDACHGLGLVGPVRVGDRFEPGL
jgi:hypothetical protein